MTREMTREMTMNMLDKIKNIRRIRQMEILEGMGINVEYTANTSHIRKMEIMEEIGLLNGAHTANTSNTSNTSNIANMINQTKEMPMMPLLNHSEYKKNYSQKRIQFLVLEANKTINRLRIALSDILTHRLSETRPTTPASKPRMEALEQSLQKTEFLISEASEILNMIKIAMSDLKMATQQERNKSMQLVIDFSDSPSVQNLYRSASEIRDIMNVINKGYNEK